jgi:hypothetical protein
MRFILELIQKAFFFIVVTPILWLAMRSNRSSIEDDGN